MLAASSCNWVHPILGNAVGCRDAVLVLLVFTLLSCTEMHQPSLLESTAVIAHSPAHKDTLLELELVLHLRKRFVQFQTGGTLMYQVTNWIRCSNSPK